MAARKRGKGGKFVKGGGKKGPKKARHHVASSGGGGLPIAALHKLDNIDKAVHRIENRLVPKRVKERLARLHSSRAAQAARRASEREHEAALAAKYS
jgi:hypothetical protein